VIPEKDSLKEEAKLADMNDIEHDEDNDNNDEIEDFDE